MSARTLYLPTLKREIERPWFLPSREAIASQNKVLASVFFLVRQGGLGERLRCDPQKGGCGGRHQYLTLRCVERPFSGLTGGLYAYYRAVGDHDLVKDLPPAERARYEGIGEALGQLGEMPDLATTDPRTARALGLKPGDSQIGALAMGILDPVPMSLARRLVARINEKGLKPPLVLPGLEAD